MNDISQTGFGNSPASSPHPAPDALPALHLANLPVLSGTQFCFELMVHGGTLDLRSAVALFGRDPVAVLRLFALVAREYPDPADRPERLEDCVVSLDGDDLLEGLYSPPSLRREQAKMILFARHAQAIAQGAANAAASLGLNRERAFLVGLLHAVGTLPAELGRSSNAFDMAATIACLTSICEYFKIPPPLRLALEAVHRRDPGSIWMALIEAAHDLEEHALKTAASHKKHDSTPF